MKQKAGKNRHLKSSEIEAAADWIKSQPDRPRWEEVRQFLLATFAVDRTNQSLMKNEVLKSAMVARKSTAPQKKLGPRPTTRKIEALNSHIDRLEVEMAELRLQNQSLIEENLQLVNGAKLRNIPERDLRRPLPPINRNATYRELR